MDKTITIHPLHDPDAAKRDLEFWMSKTPAERVDAVEFLRRMYYGKLLDKPMAKVFRIIDRKSGKILCQSDNYEELVNEYLFQD